MERVRDGDLVLYTTGDRSFGAVVDGTRWTFGGGHVVVNLRGLGDEYRAYTGVERSRVNAARVRDLRPLPTEYVDGEWVVAGEYEPAAVITYVPEPSPETGHVSWCWWALGRMGDAPSYEAAKAAAEAVIAGHP